MLLKSVKNLLSENLTTTQRGILITAILCKDINEKITLAKFKTFINVKEFRKDLIELQERGFIKWSGYNRAVKAEANKKQDPKIVEIITFFNDLCKRNVNPETETQVKELRNRLLDHSVEDIKLVISNRYEVWKDDNVMKHHLQPTTIFRKSKFDKYIEEAKRTKVGSR